MISLVMVNAYSPDFQMSGVILFIAMFLFIGIYFYTKMARLSFRLADEQDYDILLSGGAVKDSESMQLFIQKILMNALKVEDNIDGSSLSRGQIQVMGNNDHTFVPPVLQPTPPPNYPQVQVPQQGAQTTPSQQDQPVSSIVGVASGDGYEWLDHDGIKWHRVENSGSEWTKW